MIPYRSDEPITADEFRDILVRSTLGERRPVDDRARISAGDGDGGCAYLSDLAVDAEYQHRGIGMKQWEQCYVLDKIEDLA